MKLTILGNNSALPQHGRFPTAQVLQVHNQWILIDCGEATQIRFQRNRLKAAKISKIFISHLHGDHYYGLIGLLTSYSLNNRYDPIDLYGPSQLIDIINLQLRASDTTFSYPLNFHNISGRSGEKIVDELGLSVTVFATEHRIECYGFRFEEKNIRKRLDIGKLEELKIPVQQYGLISNGKDAVTEDGTIINNEMVTFPPHEAKVYSYCADTRFTESFLPFIINSDYIYHETTYLEDHYELAYCRFHSTTKEATQIATLSNAKNLIIGHFSSKYRDIKIFLDECKALFNNTHLAEEGKVFEI